MTPDFEKELCTVAKAFGGRAEGPESPGEGEYFYDSENLKKARDFRARANASAVPRKLHINFEPGENALLEAVLGQKSNSEALPRPPAEGPKKPPRAAPKEQRAKENIIKGEDLLDMLGL